MFELYADKNKLTVREKEPLTSGSVNVYQVRFRFSDDWEGLSKTAVFRLGCKEKIILLDGDGECTIPWEVLKEPGWYLLAGVCGKLEADIVLPTIWANLGLILEGVTDDGEPSQPPTPELWEQLLARKGDKLAYTEDGELGLFSGDKELSSVPIQGGGGEGGTTDHRRLKHRDAAEQHPISAITGLEEELERIPGPVEALTNYELEALLK